MSQNIDVQKTADAPAVPTVNKTALILSAKTSLSILGWEFIILWAVWWVISLFQGRMIFGEKMWFPAWQFLGLDFYHNYFGAISWLSGRDPYLNFFGDTRGFYSYPPIVLPLFAWCGWFKFPQAVFVMTAFIACVVTLATEACLQFRRAAGLTNIPAPLAIGAMLMSMPVLFAMERGNCDAYVLLLLVIAAWSLGRGRGVGWDLLAAVSLAIAAWIKIYPGLVMVGLLGLRRYRAFVMSVLAAFLTWGLALSATREWMTVSQSVQSSRVGPLQNIVSWLSGKAAEQPFSLQPWLLVVNHSLSSYWSSAWLAADRPGLARVPGMLVAMIVLSPLMAWGSYRMFRSRAHDRLCYPYLLWVATVGTFFMPMSYDYNLIYLPLLIVAVWDHRDSWPVQALVATALLWWQPLALAIPHAADVMMAAKLLSFAGVTLCLVQRMKGDARGAVAADEHPSPSMIVPI